MNKEYMLIASVKMRIIEVENRKEKAELDIQNAFGNLIGLGRPFINKPYLVKRF